MRIAVIGATGHIGTWLIPRLVSAGHEVTVVSRGERAPYHDAPEWKSVDMLRIDRVAAELDGTFGYLIAAASPDAVVDLTCFDIASAKPLVEALRGKIQHLVHCGTLWVHGVPRARPYDETAPREPFGDYGVRKAEIEAFLLDEARRGFPATILHPGHITGPGWNPINPAGNLDPAVFDRLARGDVVTLPDDGSATLQHVHADDVALAFQLALEQPEQSIGEAFHVAARAPITLRAYADAAASWFGKQPNLAFLPWDEWAATVSQGDAALTRDHVVHSPDASIAKAEQRLGFSPRYTAAEAARDAVMSRR